jgi:hypothetical protein
MNMFFALQAHWCGYNTFSYYKKSQCAAISSQYAMWSHIARRELKLLQRVCVWLLLFSFCVLGVLQHVLLLHCIALRVPKIEDGELQSMLLYIVPL